MAVKASSFDTLQRCLRRSVLLFKGPSGPHLRSKKAQASRPFPRCPSKGVYSSAQQNKTVSPHRSCSSANSSAKGSALFPLTLSGLTRRIPALASSAYSGAA